MTKFLPLYAPAVLSPKKPWSGLICGIPPRKQRRDVWSERVDSRRQPRQLARDRVLVEHALGYRPMQLGLRQPEGRRRGRLVAGCDRGLDLFHKGPHAAHPGAIDGRTFGRLPDALFR